MVLVETERLFIRDWVPDDWKRYKPLATDPRVLKYIGVDPSPDERIQAFVERGIQTAKARGWILWPVIHRDDAELIGFCGFNDGFPSGVELGWRLRPEYWGRGLATEIARAVMEYGWNEFGFERLISVIHPDNRASIRVAEKLGMSLDGTLSYHGKEVLRYAKNNPRVHHSDFTPFPPLDLLDRLLRHDAWTTCELLRLCGHLNDAQLDQEFDIARRTVRATLSHMITNVEVWTDLMAGRRPRTYQGESITELSARAARAFAGLETVARSVSDRGAWNERFLDVLDNPPTQKTFGGGIAHVITHSMHHRAQLLYMLRRLGVKDLPEGDVLTWEQQAAGVLLQEVRKSDLAEFFEQQREPEAVEMAAFPPREREDFMAHWDRILADPKVMARTILVDGAVTGNVICWEQEGQRLVGYWLGRRYWGKGVATQALSAFVAAIRERPLHAHVAKHNLASIRVLEKCGFQLTGENRSAAPTGGEAVDGFVYVLK